ncbi:hypothetical protein R3W88_008405 [Solanum pinnatisectum]|uniref:Uncharacterized protein n=1 Tax=Solanum pinnatisectum TaxID=50273 RepID=A0AAV9MAM6_9SOLN|nr:hypothetical protein R3W88_008405 [Solanum pinnatisectum]
MCETLRYFSIIFPTASPLFPHQIPTPKLPPEHHQRPNPPPVNPVFSSKHLQNNHISNKNRPQTQPETPRVHHLQKPTEKNHQTTTKTQPRSGFSNSHQQITNPRVSQQSRRALKALAKQLQNLTRNTQHHPSPQLSLPFTIFDQLQAGIASKRNHGLQQWQKSTKRTPLAEAASSGETRELQQTSFPDLLEYHTFGLTEKRLEAPNISGVAFH